MAKTIKLSMPGNEVYRKLFASIQSPDQNKQLQEILRSDLDLDIVADFDKNNRENTPLIYAIIFRNEEAVRMIVEKLKGTRKLSNLTIEIEGLSALHYATITGIPNIINYILSANIIDVNSISKNGPALLYAVTSFSPFSIINHSIWNQGVNNDDIKKALIKWNNGTGDFPKENLCGEWKGNLKTIQMLLNLGADPALKDTEEETEDTEGFSALSLISGFTEPDYIKSCVENDAFTSDARDSSVSFIKSDSDSLTVDVVLMNLKGQEQTVRVIYDIREVRALLEKYKDQNKDKGACTKKIDALEAEVKVAIESTRALELTSKIIVSRQAKQEDELRKQQEATIEAKESADRANARLHKHAFLINQHDAMLRRSIEVKEKADKLRGASLEFYNKITKNLQLTLDMYKIAAADKFKRDDTTKGAIAGSVLSFIGNVVPAPFSSAFAIFGSIVTAVAYKIETKHYQKIAAVLPLDKELNVLVEELALDLIAKLNSYSKGSFEIDKLPQSEIDDVFNLFFAVAVYTIYNVDKLKIDKPDTLHGHELGRIIREKINIAIEKEEPILELLAKVKAKMVALNKKEAEQKAKADRSRVSIDQEANDFVAVTIDAAVAGRGRSTINTGLPPASASRTAPSPAPAPIVPLHSLRMQSQPAAAHTSKPLSQSMGSAVGSAPPPVPPRPGVSPKPTLIAFSQPLAAAKSAPAPLEGEGKKSKLAATGSTR